LTTLLAVDDSKTMRKVIEITFAGENLNTVLAASAQEAIDKLFQAPAEIALIDAGLEGGRGGYDLCRRIKSEFPNTHVLLLTSKQNPYDAAQGAAVGATGNVDKPFDTQSIIDRIGELASVPAAQAEPPVLEPEEVPVLEPESQPPVLEPESQPPMLEPESPVSGAGALQPEPAPWHADTSQADEVEEIEAVTIPPSGETEAVASGNGAAAKLEGRLKDLGLTPEQVAGVLALSKEVVEQAVWEVVPALAETMIREEIARLTK
jgi:CheY-like chemotaxis protein